MGESNVRLMLAPDYYEKFSCTGGECSDICCSGWTILLDEGSYKRYMKLAKTEKYKHCGKYISRNKREASSAHYGKLNFTKEGYCPFLAENGLCSIHLEYGDRYLSDICSTFPRFTNIVDGRIEKSLALSCPEAARLVLANDRVMVFNETVESTDARNIIRGVVNTSESGGEKTGIKFFWDIRYFIIKALQDRAYSLQDRIMGIGMFCDRLNRLIAEGQAAEIPQLVNAYTEMLQQGSLMQSLTELPEDVSFQLRLLDEIIGKRLQSGRLPVMYEPYVKDIREAIFAIGQDPVTIYSASLTNYLQPFLRQREYMLEHYFVNYVFRYLFPFGDTGSVVVEFAALALHFALIRYHLAGLGASRKGLDTDSVVDFLQCYAKTYEQDASYIKSIYHIVQKSGYGSLGHLMLLLNVR